jgi:uncharacterized membrane protein
VSLEDPALQVMTDLKEVTAVIVLSGDPLDEAHRRMIQRGVRLLLRAVRPLVPLVGLGLVLTIAAGAWLAHELGFPYGSGWLRWTYALIAWLVVVGALAGRLDRRTRELAEREASAGDEASSELIRRLRDPVALTLDASMLAATLAIVALMVWKP